VNVMHVHIARYIVVVWYYIYFDTIVVTYIVKKTHSEEAKANCIHLRMYKIEQIWSTPFCQQIMSNCGSSNSLNKYSIKNKYMWINLYPVSCKLYDLTCTLFFQTCPGCRVCANIFTNESAQPSFQHAQQIIFFWVLGIHRSLGPVYEFVCISFRTDNLNCFRASWPWRSTW
jgi:hypothetical protein